MTATLVYPNGDRSPIAPEFLRDTSGSLIRSWRRQLDSEGLVIRGTLWERIAELDPTPAWPVAPEGYGRDPWHDRDDDGICRVCGDDGSAWEPNYSEYVDRWTRDEYEGDPGHNPMAEDIWTYLKTSCAGPWAAPQGFVSSVEIPRPCGRTRPQTLGYQRCERVAGHTHFHRSQDDVRWNDGEFVA